MPSGSRGAATTGCTTRSCQCTCVVSFVRLRMRCPLTLRLVLPRRGATASDAKWFHWDPDYFEGHFSNAFEKDGKVYADFPVIKGNVMSWFPDKNGYAPPRPSLKTFFARFELDPKAEDLRLADPVKLCEISGEFSRIDDRFVGRDYQWTYIAAINMQFPYDREKSGGRPFPGFNCIGRMNNKTGQVDYWSPGPCASVGEPSFIPRSPNAAEGDGFVICRGSLCRQIHHLADRRHRTLLSDQSPRHSAVRSGHP